MGNLTADTIAWGLTSYVVLLFSLSVHESAHGWVAHLMGDDTAIMEGRVSLNPLVHIDPLGTFLIPMLQIFWNGIPLLAWAKPTPVGAHNFRRLARGHILVAGAGPVSNLILAILFTIALFFARRADLGSELYDPVRAIILVGIQMNVGLAIFNLVPLPPLDGSWVASWGLPRHIANHYDRIMEPWGSWILLILFVTNILSWVLHPLRVFLIQVLYSLAI